ncbi:hypothetical protein [Colwellia echini]|uniref:Uncharacterized protein n=1 Tax=Colwellia echini TaxID=1982103 RepID=A0ABY3MSN8_9GAMM|nr:hypothetical protein [Colwellia echini]TYK64199.1 hypothetical protein CWS31_016880 [Colwellia echini]
MKHNLNRSDWLGILIGIIAGVVQTLVLANKEVGFPMPPSLLPIALFGLGGPPVLAVVNKLFKTAKSTTQLPMSKNVNLIFMVIAMGLSTGFVGLVYHFAIGLPANSLMPIVFLGTSGFGFILAHLIYPDLANRQTNT